MHSVCLILWPFCVPKNVSGITHTLARTHALDEKDNLAMSPCAKGYVH